MPGREEGSQQPTTKESLAGKRVTFDEMCEITKPHEEEKSYSAFGHNYPDFYRFYRSEFPSAYLSRRVRLSEGVRTFLESSRPEPIKIPLDAVKERIETDEELTLSVAEFLGEPRLRVQFKEDAGKERPWISLYPDREIEIFYGAEVDKTNNQLVFTPEIANNAGAAYPQENLERRILDGLGLRQVNASFPEQIRIEHLISYNGYPDREQVDNRGYPLWKLSEVPIIRISLVSGPAAEEIEAREAAQIPKTQ